MNASHMIGKKRNRLKRCIKRLASTELVSSQRNMLVQRQAELERELNQK